MILIISCVFPPEPVVSASLSKDIADKLSVSEEVTVLHPKPSRPDGFKFDCKTTGTKSNYTEIIVDSYTCSRYSVMGRLRESNSFGKKSVDYIKKHHKKIKSIYLNTWPLLAQYRIVKIAKHLNIPCVSHIHDIYPESYTNRLPLILQGIIKALLLPLDKFILKNSTKVISVSDSMKEVLSQTRKIDSKHISVIYNWQDESKFQESNNMVNDKFTFMYLGNLGPYSCIDVIINAFVKLNNCRLIIAGSGSMENCLRDHAKTVGGDIVFMKAIREEVPQIQNIANIFILSLKTGGAKTGMPSKIPAYMFSSKPIIACIDADSDAARAIITSGCGRVTEPENIELLAAEMTRMYNLPTEQLELMGKEGKEYALQHFSKKNNLKNITTLIQNIANGNLG